MLVFPLSLPVVYSSQTDHVNEENCSEFPKTNEGIVNKFGLHMALSHFVGKRRAKEIRDSPKNKHITDYKDITKSHIMDQIEKLQNANLYNNGWKKIVCDNDSKDLCTPNNINRIQNQATYVAMILYMALEKYNTIIKFLDIVQLAMDKVNECHLIKFLPKRVKCKTNFIIQDVRHCYDIFCEFCENDYFHNPARDRNKLKHNIPRIFNENPDCLKMMTNFCRENIKSLTVEAVHEFMLETALPKLLNKLLTKESKHIQTMSDLFAYYGLKNLHIKTIQNWMRSLGFKYEPRKIVYYIDTHETKENIKYRSEYIDTYFQYEFLAHRWYSISEEKRKELIESGKLGVDSGYKYIENDKVLYKYHVDDHESFQKECADLEFGGNLSVRRPLDEKKIMMWGQDEVIMKQKLLTLLSWNLPDGSKPLDPKDDGCGLMMSAFTSCKLGFGFTVPEEVLKSVNEICKGCEYSDADAALEITGSRLKGDLTRTPFLRQLDYGKNNEGYWTYSHMVLQFEDCMDVLKYMLPDFNHIFSLITLMVTTI